MAYVQARNISESDYPTWRVYVPILLTFPDSDKWNNRDIPSFLWTVIFVMDPKLQGLDFDLETNSHLAFSLRIMFFVQNLYTGLIHWKL